MNPDPHGEPTGPQGDPLDDGALEDDALEFVTGGTGGPRPVNTTLT